EQPAWSPCGDRVVYVHSTAFDDHELFRMRPDGTDRAPLLPRGILPVNATDPRWSRDCASIAFTGTIPGQPSQVSVVKSDGGGPLPDLTAGDASSLGPAFSPDGGRIAFVGDAGGRFQLYAMSADGSGPVRLTTGAGADQEPAWQPVGAGATGSIVFVND